MDTLLSEAAESRKAIEDAKASLEGLSQEEQTAKIIARLTSGMNALLTLIAHRDIVSADSYNRHCATVEIARDLLSELRTAELTRRLLALAPMSATVATETGENPSRREGAHAE